MKSDKLLNVFRSSDARVAMRAPGRDCPGDRELSEFAVGQSPDEAAGLLQHLMGCERCRNLVRLLRSDERPPLWARAATRRATRRWERKLERQATCTLRLLPVGAGLDFVAVAAAPGADAQTAQLTLERPTEKLSLHVREGDEPLAGVQVRLTRHGGAEVRTCRTDKCGLVNFTDLPAGAYTVSAPGLSRPMVLRRGEPD